MIAVVGTGPPRVAMGGRQETGGRQTTGRLLAWTQQPGHESIYIAGQDSPGDQLK